MTKIDNATLAMMQQSGAFGGMTTESTVSAVPEVGQNRLLDAKTTSAVTSILGSVSEAEVTVTVPQTDEPMTVTVKDEDPKDVLAAVGIDPETGGSIVPDTVAPVVEPAEEPAVALTDEPAVEEPNVEPVDVPVQVVATKNVQDILDQYADVEPAADDYEDVFQELESLGIERKRFGTLTESAIPKAVVEWYVGEHACSTCANYDASRKGDARCSAHAAVIDAHSRENFEKWIDSPTAHNFCSLYRAGATTESIAVGNTVLAYHNGETIVGTVVDTGRQITLAYNGRTLSVEPCDVESLDSSMVESALKLAREGRMLEAADIWSGVTEQPVVEMRSHSCRVSFKGMVQESRKIGARWVVENAYVTDRAVAEEYATVRGLKNAETALRSDEVSSLFSKAINEHEVNV